jgi:hypothetical protein
MGIKDSYGMGLKSAQAWGCPCSMKCLFKEIRSALALSIHLLCTYIYIQNRFWKLTDRYKCAQSIGKIFPTPSFPFIMRGWIADYEVACGIR